MRDRRLLTIDEGQVRSRAQRIAARWERSWPAASKPARQAGGAGDAAVGRDVRVQVKVRRDAAGEEALVARMLELPPVMVISRAGGSSTIPIFCSTIPAGVIRYREDYLLDRGLSPKGDSP